MASNSLTKLVRFLGWLLFILSLLIVIAGLFANDGDPFGIGLIIFFVILVAFGFFLTRYRKGKKTEISENNKNPKKTLTEKLEENIEKSKQREKELQSQIELLKEQSKKKPIELAPQEETPKPKKTRKIANKAPPGVDKNIFTIVYADYSGKESLRDIEINSFLEEDGKFYVYAYCYLRKTFRQFLVERIETMQLKGGDPIDNPQQFLWDKYHKQFKPDGLNPS